MGLFTNPLTIVDADVQSRVFEFRAQLSEPGAIVGEYIEPAAEVAANSKLVVKHSTSKAGKKRHLLQRTEVFDLTADPSDGSDGVIINLTINHHPLATAAQISNQLNLIIDAAQETDFVAKIIREQI